MSRKTDKDVNGMAKRLAAAINKDIKIGGQYGYTTVSIRDGNYPTYENGKIGGGPYYKQIDAFNGSKKEVYYALLAACEVVSLMKKD